MSVEGTKFQVNYKLPDGTLINLYAKDVRDLETGLTDLSMVSTLIKTTGRELLGGASAPAPTAESIAKQFETPPQAQPVSVERWLPYDKRERRVVLEPKPCDPCVEKPKNGILFFSHSFFLSLLNMSLFPFSFYCNYCCVFAI